ncbi:hypothetical protein [Novosphingobium organovorum]|uniref:hypothetical protein n=1 Tax=Novosphingobium organovorum TaxID=2930092 RepID=UPI002E15A722
MSSPDYVQVGSSCISERRAIDTIEGREPPPFLSYGETVSMTARRLDGFAPFGTIRNKIARG